MARDERLGMDIAYLLWLQGIRESLPPFVESFFVAVSDFASSNALIIIPCLLFWCFDKRAGRLMLFSFTFATMLNQLIKNTVCCTRPWIRSSQLRPAAGALPDATGYSFPSGHTQSATSLFGTLGWYYRKRWPVLFGLCCAFVLLVGFSRNFLSVHAPQDVLVAIVEGVLVLLAVERLLAWVDEASGRDALLLVGCLVVAVAYMLYIGLKPYPMDRTASGALLYDPLESIVDSFESLGVFVGAVLGWFLERRYVGFEVDPKAMGWKRMLVRVAVGMAVVGILFLASRALVLAGASPTACEFAKSFCAAFGATFAAPAVFAQVEKAHA